MKTKVVVVIPNWNGEDYISDCLQSLEKQTLKPDILVVDNNSVDNSVKIIKDNHPRVELLEFSDNAGFAGGVNRGIKPSLEQYKYIALLNNDAVADSKWLEKLVAVADEKPNAGIITGKFMRIDKKHIDSTGDFYTIWGMPYPRDRNEIDSGQRDNIEPVFGATGGASLYSTEMFKEIGIFDEDFFAYYEDVDISFRAQLAGWKVYYQPSALAYHHVGGTSSKLGDFSRYHTIKNFYFIIMKNLPWQLLIIYSPFLLLQSLRILATTTIKNKNPLIFFRSLFKALSLLPKKLKERRQIQKTRKISVLKVNKLIEKRIPPIIKKI